MNWLSIRLAQKIPVISKEFTYEEDETRKYVKSLTTEEEEIGCSSLEIIHGDEEEETLKVQEFVDIDTNQLLWNGF